MENVLEKQVLDVRELAPKDRHSKIMETFSGLGPGESFVLVNDHEPKPLLYQFQAEHDGEFDWWPLERGPELWRVEIAKRKEANAQRTVTEYLQTDHRRLDGIFERFLQEVKAGKWDEAVTDFKEFSLGLKRHIKIEEEILFPVFEEKTGMVDAGPTFVMRMEHQEIQKNLDNTLASAEAKDASGVEEATGALSLVLGDHNMKEENILYPESDSFLSDEERTTVVKKAQAL